MPWIRRCYSSRRRIKLLLAGAVKKVANDRAKRIHIDQKRIVAANAVQLNQRCIFADSGQAIGKQAILDGKIVCDPIQFPDRIGQATIEMIIKHFNGEEVPAEVLIPSELYYQDDAKKDPALKTSAP